MFALPSLATLKLAGVAVLAAGSFWAGYQWHAGRVAQADLEAKDHAQDLQRHARRGMDASAGQHAQTLATLNTQLGDARVQIDRLAGRDCLDPNTVGVLNDIGRGGLRAAAGDAEGAPPAASTGGGLRFTTDRDAASAIAICRAKYAEVSSQLDKILDIEDRRHPPAN